MYVDRLPHSGESLVAKRVFREHGGKGLNLGLGLHRLGAKVDMLLAVGADDAGEAVRRALVAEGMRDDSPCVRAGPLVATTYPGRLG